MFFYSKYPYEISGLVDLNLCMLGNFSCFYCRLRTFFKIHFFKKKIQFRNSIRVSNCLDPDQQGHSGPDLGPNCLQRLSANDNSHH